MRKTLIALGTTALLATTVAPALALADSSTAPATQQATSESSSTVYQIEQGFLRVVQPGKQDHFSGTFIDGTVEVTVAEGRYYTFQIDALQIDTTERIPVPVQATFTYDRKSAFASVIGNCTVLKNGETAAFAGNVRGELGRFMTVMNSKGDSISVRLKKSQP